MRSIKSVLAVSFLAFAVSSIAEDLPVSLDIALSANVLDPLEMGMDTTGYFVSRENGLAKGTVGNGKPRTAQFLRYYELVAAPILPAPAECLEGGNAFLGRVVIRNEISLVFNDLSAVSAKQNGGYVCLDITPGNPSVVNAVWFSSPLEIQGGVGRYEGATGQMELQVDLGNVNTAEAGVYVGSASVDGVISTP